MRSKLKESTKKSSNMQQLSIRKYLRKRSGSPLGDYPISAKRIKLDVKDAVVKTEKTKRPKNEGKRYRKGGLVHTLHGVVYQLKLLMLFLKRALDRKYEFNLGTEMDDAEKFDDIVFTYKSGRDKVRFVQAKHKQDESKKIRSVDLLAKNASGNDFSLQKYFTSFRKIKESLAFSEYELKDFIVCTNIDFDYSDLEKAKIHLINFEEYDEILHFNKSEKAAVRYKFIFGEDHVLNQTLTETSDLYLLARNLMYHAVNNVPIKLSGDDIWKRFHVPLRAAAFTAVKVEETEKTKQQNSKQNVHIKFSDDFVENKNLSEEVSNFREVLKSLFDKKDDDATIKKKLRELKLSVPSNFGEEFTLKREPLLFNPKILAELIVKNSSAAKENVVAIRRTARISKDLDMLAGHVLVLDDQGVLLRFRKAFFDDNHKLSGNLNFFRKHLKLELAKEHIAFSKLREYQYIISNYNTCKETSEGELLPICESRLPSGTVKNELMREFFEKLIFAVNQPSEVELGEIISKELGESMQFNLLNHGLVGDSFQRQILDWFKEKGDTKGKEGRFLNYETGKEFFDSIEQQVNGLICVALSLQVCDELQMHFVTFEKNDILDYLEAFLSDQNIWTKVLHIVSPKKTIVSEMKLYSALKNLKQKDTQYKKQDSYIFIKLRSLLRPNMQKVALEAFKALGSHHLLIIICDSTKKGTEIETLYTKLSKILSETNKRIILIAEKDNSLVNKFPPELIRNFESTTSFDHLTNESKKRLLGKKVSFQGRRRNLKLRQLFELNGKEISSNQLNIFDSETLTQLISGNVINIGRSIMGKSDLEGAYNKLYEEINKNILIEILQDSINRLEFFVISGLDGEHEEAIVKDLKLNKNETCKLNNDTMCIKRMTKIMLADSKFNENNFEVLCDNRPNANFHWILREDNKYILRTLYNPKFIERKFKYPKKINFCFDVKMELLNCSDSVFFVTGVAEEEYLFKVLRLQDSAEQQNLMQQISCGKIILHSSSSRNESEFKNLTIEKAEENTCVYWLDINYDGGEQIIWRDVTRHTVSEEDLIGTLKDQSSIIIDKPGMGKSTTIAILSEKMLKTHWVIFISFRDWQDVISNLPETIDIDIVIEFLSDTKNVNTRLEKNLARFLLDKDRKGGLMPLLLVFDGFDEIRSYCAENAGKRKAEELLRFLKENTRSTVWITAREQDTVKLQNILSTFCVKFEPLEKDEHYVYFKDFWSNSLKLSVSKDEFNKIFSGDNNKFQAYYNALSKAANKIFANKDNDFMGIPLTLRLFAEGFRNKFKEFVLSDECNENFAKDFDNLSILNLYKYFVDAKFLIFIHEKTNLSTGFTKTSEDWFIQKLIKLHCRLAFKELFGGDETKELLGLKQPFEGEDSDVNSVQLKELLHVGIIRSIKENHYEFLHRTVAEYLASRLLIYILKNKEHNNLAKYKRTLKFLRSNILKQSNEIIKNFLKAGLHQDEKLHTILLPIIEDIESKNLLGQVSSKYTFITEARRYKKPGNLNEIKLTIQKIVKPGVRYYSLDVQSDTFEFIISNEFKPSFIHETDITKLRNSLGYLMNIYGKVSYRKGRSINKVNYILRDNIVDFISHYILQAEKQNTMDKDFIENCIKKICTKPIREKRKNDSQQVLNNVIDSMFESGTLTLTTQTAKEIISKFNKTPDTIFCSLISPFFSFKYYCSKYSFIFVNNIDNTALLHIFQFFASATKRRKVNMDLSEASLKGILHCIQESLNLVTFSIDSFTASVKALIALGNWDFQLSYANSALSLSHGHDYKNELNLKYEENIIELLVFRNNNPESNFDAKLAAVANNLSVVTPASI